MAEIEHLTLFWGDFISATTQNKKFSKYRSDFIQNHYLSSIPKMSQLAQTMSNLRDMFPNHSTQLIERVMRECNMNAEAAISRLLKMKADVKGRKHETDRRWSNQAPEIIFPPEFLRWPKNIKWDRINIDQSLAGNVYIGDDDSNIIPDEGPTEDSILDMPTENLTPGIQNDIWSKIKSRIA